MVEISRNLGKFGGNWRPAAEIEEKVGKMSLPPSPLMPPALTQLYPSLSIKTAGRTLESVMKVVILCGGMGTRMRDVSETIPKPMVPIGSQPIVWHIMKYYASFGHKDFILCLGYKKEAFIDYFLHYTARNSDIVVELGSKPSHTFLSNNSGEDWRVMLADTGVETLTGSRIKRVAKYIDAGPFMLTYGDGLCDIDLRRCCAATGERPTRDSLRGASGWALRRDRMEGRCVWCFAEKPQMSQGYINGGFMVMEKAFIERYIRDESTACWRRRDGALRARGQLNAYCHEGFWQCMDTAREHRLLSEMWERGAPWKTWR